MTADETAGETPLWEQRVTVSSAEETQEIAAALGRQLEAGDLLVLTGGLGAGKTTFTQGLGQGLGVRPGIISPTFVLVRIHPNLPDGPRPGGPDLVHVDAYRLESASEIDGIDLENTLDTAVTVVEWGRGRVEHLSASRLDIELVRATGLAGPPAATPSTDGSDPAGGPLEFGELDFSDEDDDEPRTLVLRGYGPRWAGQPSLRGSGLPAEGGK
ncbi:tRNA (adenosine(37)-N6)-threonylcarbamoyltransferase complex ATPase subunit type 1 TsaE [Pseudarthrobacter sp. J64]|uniref:tRNA (adenosine(37)-N6)-threonylcarbamoyltransferase complex ATPase subunit type 1 TsaE n=1 Tax=Pseudarthrobacter sp. J64 TaxID=3116485 RepID=UPI002E80FE24|nr:tRNA (adenosine(37)-N6)-threonylcarbamoyltransferase complex ATPase subunit type 1 TsaE [Pseudarthrobacter sp. J64]MEE2568136.1 tRNA (adenosine(37)-N6)-threonylcarbamoyltransferase complex ATPase subunit type 1 TsaE [Pseudarthrobacter sp. J64]